MTQTSVSKRLASTLLFLPGLPKHPDAVATPGSVVAGWRLRWYRHWTGHARPFRRWPRDRQGRWRPSGGLFLSGGRFYGFDFSCWFWFLWVLSKSFLAETDSYLAS